MSESAWHNFEDISYNSSESNQICPDSGVGTNYGRNTTRSKQPCCVSMKMAIIVLISAAFVATLFATVLYLTVFQIHVQTYPGFNNNVSIEVYNCDQVGYTYNLNGSNTHNGTGTVDIFESIPNKSSLVHLNLANIHVNPTIMVKQLDSLSNLISLKLINVTLNGSMGIHDKAFLSNLKKYVLELNEPIGPNQALRLKNTNCTVQDINSAFSLSTFEHHECLRSLIFFYKAELGPNWEMHQISLLNTTIQISLFGVHIFLIDPTKGQITSRLFYTQQILDFVTSRSEKIYQTFDLRELHLATCSVNISTLMKFSTQLTQLSLINVNLTGQDPRNNLSQSLRQFKLLKKLEYYGTNKLGPGQVAETIDLNDLSLALDLRVLSFAYIYIDYNKETSYSRPKLILDAMYLNGVAFKNPDIITKFHLIFDVKKLVFDYINFDAYGFSRFQFWLNVIEMTNIEHMIFIRSYDSFTSLLPAVQDQLSTAIQTKLNLIGVNINITEPFVLKRTNAASHWEGRNFNASSSKEMLKLHVNEGNMNEDFYKLDTFMTFSD